MAQPITPERVTLDIKSARDPQISPDGRSVVYGLATVDRDTKKAETQLWIRNIDGGDARRLTWSGEQNNGARWSPDGKQIAFVSNRVKRAGIFVMPAHEPSEAREVTRHQQGISDLVWSPDGSKLAYTTAYDPDNPGEEEPKEGEPAKVRVTRRVDYKGDGRGYLGDVRSQVWVVDVASGERHRLTGDPIDHSSPRWSPDGTRIAARISTHNSTRSQIALIDGATGAQTIAGPDDGRIGPFAWSPGGNRIVYAGDAEHNDQHDFYLYETSSGQIRRLTDDFALALDPAAPLVWLDERQVLFHGVERGASRIGVLDTESGRIETRHGWEALNSGLSLDRAGRHLAQSHASLERTGEIAILDRESGDWRVLTSFNDDLFRETPPAQWERVEIERAGFTVEAWLLKPADFDPAKRYPLVLDVHGGPHGHYSYSFNALQQCLATNGFLVLACNPRGSTSYGRAFTQAVNRDWGGEDYLDLMALLDTVLERPYADAERIGISGYSYGGYMTSWVIGQTQRFKAAVCGAPVFDIESEWGTSDISHGAGENHWYGAPHEHPEWYREHSPVTYIHRATTPTLIIQGEADQRCPVGQAEQMFVGLKKAGCEVEFVRYPGMSHGFPRSGPPAYQLDRIERMLAWFKHYLGEPA